MSCFFRGASRRCSSGIPSKHLPNSININITIRISLRISISIGLALGIRRRAQLLDRNLGGDFLGLIFDEVFWEGNITGYWMLFIANGSDFVAVFLAAAAAAVAGAAAAAAAVEGC